MSHDGCIEVAWKGQAFSYLLHHSGFHKTENYGTKRHEQHSSATSAVQQNLSDTQTKAGTGTWQGPAPKGFGVVKEETAQDLARSAALEPTFARLGNGQTIPFLGLGVAGVADQSVIDAALAAGIRHFDCTSATPAEESILGAGLAAFLAANGDRASLFLTVPVRSTTVVGGAAVPATVPTAEEVLSSVSASLLALHVDYLDLVLLPAAVDNCAAAAAVTWRALQDLVAAGKVRNLGVSNYSLVDLESLAQSASASPSASPSISPSLKPLVNQIELHPRLAQRKLVGVSLRKGILSVAHTPLGGVEGSKELLVVPAVQAIVESTGRTAAQVLLRWNVQRGVPVVFGVSGVSGISADQQKQWVKEAAEGVRGWKLDYVQKAALDAVDASATSAAKRDAEVAKTASKRFYTPQGLVFADAEEGGAVKPSTVL
uniref:NADP-dependent oxidoreductase domain-containing protein n=2 Tax=Polytomella parva TaxID=51329 RepID=A0A7S0VKS4_9CHLO|nr:NADPH-dependent aldo-keto reductase, chloroplastic isoform X2 (AKRC) [Polytomella parva]